MRKCWKAHEGVTEALLRQFHSNRKSRGLQLCSRLVWFAAAGLAMALLAVPSYADSCAPANEHSWNSQAIGIIATGIGGIVSFLATYSFNVRLETRRANVSFISSQLEKLYGPLLALHSASGEAWDQFRSHCRPTGALFDDDNPLTEEEARAFRHWMTIVFMPANISMQKVITENAHLIDGSAMPQEFLDLLAHVQVYSAVMAYWKSNDAGAALTDRATNVSYLNYPEGFGSYIAGKFNELKARQDDLLAKSRRASPVT